MSDEPNESKATVGAEDEKVAKMGCPSLGEHIRLEVVIEESYEFKVTVAKMLDFTINAVREY